MKASLTYVHMYSLIGWRARLVCVVASSFQCLHFGSRCKSARSLGMRQPCFQISAKVDTNSSVSDRDETINEKELGDADSNASKRQCYFLLGIDGDKTRDRFNSKGFVVQNYVLAPRGSSASCSYCLERSASAPLTVDGTLCLSLTSGGKPFESRVQLQILHVRREPIE
jgi:hypothetical protein